MFEKPEKKMKKLLLLIMTACGRTSETWQYEVTGRRIATKPLFSGYGFCRLCKGMAEISPFRMFAGMSHPLTRNCHSLTGP